MYESVTWFPICAGLSAIGVVAAFFAFRRRGVASGLRLLGWAVLPMAVYLTGMVRLLWTIGAEVARWIAGFVFSPTVWAGLALFAFAAVVLPVAAGLRRRRAKVAGGSTAGVSSGAGGRQLGTGADTAAASSKSAGKARSKQPASKSKGKKQDDDPLEGMEEIEEILKRRGIT